ncbi:hypothetical protein TNCV_1929761 [Trichonephila clavipes]|nr:hypothetical protein TNCV_1929761 [Trichonephila clavipes]
MPHRRILAHYEQLPEFERCHIIRLKEAVPWSLFRLDNARPSTERIPMNCFIACQTDPWPAVSPDLSQIEHVWDVMRRQLHLPGNVDD